MSSLDSKLILDALDKLFAEHDAKWDWRFAELDAAGDRRLAPPGRSQAAGEQRDAAPEPLVEQPAHDALVTSTDPAPAPDATSADSDAPPIAPAPDAANDSKFHSTNGDAATTVEPNPDPEAGHATLVAMESSHIDDIVDLDRLSILPDALLRNIVSCLPVKDAGRTAVLSCRWKPLWCAAPSVSRVQIEAQPVLLVARAKHERHATIVCTKGLGTSAIWAVVVPEDAADCGGLAGIGHRGLPPDELAQPSPSWCSTPGHNHARYSLESVATARAPSSILAVVPSSPSRPDPVEAAEEFTTVIDSCSILGPAIVVFQDVAEHNQPRYLTANFAHANSVGGGAILFGSAAIASRAVRRVFERIFAQNLVQLRQPWPPPMEFDCLGKGVDQSLLFGFIQLVMVHKQPWPPPVQFVILGDGVQVRPTPWPSFSGATTRFKCNVCKSLILLDSEGLQQSVQIQTLLTVPWPPPVWKFLSQWLYAYHRQQYMFLTKSLSMKITCSLDFKLGHRWPVEGLVFWIYCHLQSTVARIVFLLHHLTVRRVKMLIVSGRVLLLLRCMCNMMIQSMQLHDDVFCRILWLDSYATSMCYNCRDYAWFKVIWQLLAVVIPAYSVQLKRGGLARFAAHSLFHEFGTNCWGLLAEMRPISSMVLFLSISKHSTNMLILDGCVNLVGILASCRSPRCFQLLSSIQPVKKKRKLLGVVLNLGGYSKLCSKSMQLSWLSSISACNLVVLWLHMHLSVYVDGSDESDGVLVAAAYKVLKLQHQLHPQGVCGELETLLAPSAWICSLGSTATKEAMIRVVLYSDLAHCQMNELKPGGLVLIKNVARKDSGAEWVSLQKLFVPYQQKHALLLGDRLLTEACPEDLHSPWDFDDSMFQHKIGNKPSYKDTRILVVQKCLHRLGGKPKLKGWGMSGITLGWAAIWAWAWLSVPMDSTYKRRQAPSGEGIDEY